MNEAPKSIRTNEYIGPISGLKFSLNGLYLFSGLFMWKDDCVEQQALGPYWRYTMLKQGNLYPNCVSFLMAGYMAFQVSHNSELQQ